MPVVNLAVSSDAFIETVDEISAWLAQEHIVSPFSAFSGDRMLRTIRLGFGTDREAEQFARRFGGDVLAPADPGSGPIGHHRVT